MVAVLLLLFPCCWYPARGDRPACRDKQPSERLGAEVLLCVLLRLAAWLLLPLQANLLLLLARRLGTSDRTAAVAAAAAAAAASDTVGLSAADSADMGRGFTRATEVLV